MSQETQTRIVIEQPETNGMATAALVLGIIGFVLGIIPLLGWLMFPLWLLAVIFGAIGAKKEIKRGQAIAGMILGVITIIFKFGFWFLLFVSTLSMGV